MTFRIWWSRQGTGMPFDDYNCNDIPISNDFSLAIKEANEFLARFGYFLIIADIIRLVITSNDVIIYEQFRGENGFIPIYYPSYSYTGKSIIEI